MTQQSHSSQYSGVDCFSFVLFTVKKIAVSFVRVVVIWYESECMFRENLNGGMSMSVFGIATSS